MTRSLSRRVCMVAAFALVALGVSPARADTLRVGSGEAYTDIDTALAAAAPGDEVLVTAGTYEIGTLRPPTGVALVGEGGPTAVHLFARGGGQAIIVENAEDVRIEGLDVYSELEVGERTNALVYLEDSSRVVIRDCYLHDAPNDADVLKLNGTVDLVVERTVIWNPAARSTSSGFQENIDIRGSGDERITLRESWLFHTPGQGDYLIYAKGGTTDLLWEANIFGPSAGADPANVPVESGHLVSTDPTPYESERFVIRNNLFVALQGTGAFAFAGPNVALLYNNVFYRNDAIRRSVIELSANRGQLGGPGLELHSYNNVFFENGDRTIYRVRDMPTAQNLTRDYNAYEAGASGGDLSLDDETNALRDIAPGFVAPAVPMFDAARGTAQIRAALEGFETSDGSPLRGAGLDVQGATSAVHPSAIAEMANRTDAFGNGRTAAWDIGLHQSCEGGGCACGAGLTECGGCVDLQSDVSHCGACDAACASSELCVSGACVAMPESDAGTPTDGGTTGGLDASTDPPEETGCACRAAGPSKSPSALALFLVLAVIAGTALRRTSRR